MESPMTLILSSNSLCARVGMQLNSQGPVYRERKKRKNWIPALVGGWLWPHARA
jgi:hypothetical protein